MPDETSPKPDSTTTQQPKTQSDTAADATLPLQSALAQRKAVNVKRTVTNTGSGAGSKSEDKTKTPAKKSISYADAGVDISSADRSKQRIKMLARKTFNRQVLSEIGGFGGLFALDLEKFPNPVLVSSADGVGTKLKVAFELGIHHTVGQDLVNH